VRRPRKNKLSETAKEKKKEEKTDGPAHYPRLGCAAPSSLPTCSAYNISQWNLEKPKTSASNIKKRIFGLFGFLNRFLTILEF
jgi:hypothetical protein